MANTIAIFSLVKMKTKMLNTELFKFVSSYLVLIKHYYLYIIYYSIIKQHHKYYHFENY